MLGKEKRGYTPATFAECKTLAYHPAHETLLASIRNHLYFCARANLQGEYSVTTWGNRSTEDERHWGRKSLRPPSVQLPPH